MKEKDIAKVAHQWGQRAPDLYKNFWGFPPIRDYLLTTITGKAEKTKQFWCERWVVEEYLNDKKPVEECLSLGCGFGHIERILADLDVFLRCTAVDISPDAIRSSMEKASEEGYKNIDYKIADLNIIELEPQKYDLIWGNAILHHIWNLEHLISEIHDALKPGGVFVCNEGIGPKYGYKPPREKEIINSVIHLIPNRLRSRSEDTFVPHWFSHSAWRRVLFPIYLLLTCQATKTRLDSLKPKSGVRYRIWLFKLYEIMSKMVSFRTRRSFRYGKVYDQDPKLVKLKDPSECVRSDEIIPILKNTFSKIDVKYYNGVILAHAIDKKFYEEYDHNRKEDKALLDLLMSIEKTMISIGEVSRDHAIIICDKGL